MKTIKASELARTAKKILNGLKDGQPIQIIRSSKLAGVLISQGDFERMKK